MLVASIFYKQNFLNSWWVNLLHSKGHEQNNYELDRKRNRETIVLSHSEQKKKIIMDVVKILPYHLWVALFSNIYELLHSSKCIRYCNSDTKHSDLRYRIATDMLNISLPSTFYISDNHKLCRDRTLILCLKYPRDLVIGEFWRGLVSLRWIWHMKPINSQLVWSRLGINTAMQSSSPDQIIHHFHASSLS